MSDLFSSIIDKIHTEEDWSENILLKSFRMYDTKIDKKVTTPTNLKKAIKRDTLITIKEPIIIGVPSEIYPNENRIALSPKSVKILTEKGITVLIEKDAGINSSFLNED